MTVAPERRVGPPRIGLQLPTTDGYLAGYGDLRRVASKAEEAGFDGLWVGDHFSFNAPVLEAFVAASTAAAVTEQVTIGFGVLIAALRHPGWVAKQVSSLQVICNDRVELGIGIGGEFVDEWRAVGVPPAERAARTDELLRHLPDLLTGQGVDLGPPWNTRIPPLQPHGTIPPLWIGGRADIALRRAVGNGAGWLGVWVDENRLAASITRLRELAGEAGVAVPPAAVEVLVHPGRDIEHGEAEMAQFMERIYGIPFGRVSRYTIAGDEDRILERLRPMVELGVDTVVLIPALRDPLPHLPALARVAAALRTAPHPRNAPSEAKSSA
jgi:alkanesulfonate monooxygenase SsuD/methylene tetrahydromethanopterin reductase-like flavin-dependent oxidoreductase (luciferase family)